MRNRTLVAMLVVWILLVAAATGARCENDRLTVVQDESSMERVIESHLKSAHQLKVDEKTEADDDLYLELPFKGDPMPDFRILIDTQSVNRNKDTNQVIERGVFINLHTDVRVRTEDMARVMAAINETTREKAFTSIFIDTDGEVVCFWVLNVLPEGLPTEYVYDAVYRVQQNWADLYPKLTEAISQSR